MVNDWLHQAALAHWLWLRGQPAGAAQSGADHQAGSEENDEKEVQADNEVKQNKKTKKKVDTLNKQIEELNNQCRESLKEYENHSRNELNSKNEKQENKAEKEEKAAPEIQLSRIWSVYDEDCMAIIEDGTCTIGRAVYDISCPELKWGDEDFVVTPVSISTIRHPGGEVCVIGTVSGCILEQAKFGNRKRYFAFGLFDGNASIQVKKIVDVDKKVKKAEEVDE